MAYLDEATRILSKVQNSDATNPFQIITDFLNSRDWEVRASALTFVNSIIVKKQDDPASKRAALRKDIEDTGIIGRIDVLMRDESCPESFGVQWRAFTEERNADALEIQASYTCLLEGLDDPRRVFNQLEAIERGLVGDSSRRWWFMSTLSSIVDNCGRDGDWEEMRVFEEVSRGLKVAGSIVEFEETARAVLGEGESDAVSELENTRRMYKEQVEISVQYKRELDARGVVQRKSTVMANGELQGLVKENARLKSAACFGRVKVGDLNVEDLYVVEGFITDLLRKKEEKREVVVSSLFNELVVEEKSGVALQVWKEG